MVSARSENSLRALTFKKSVVAVIAVYGAGQGPSVPVLAAGLSAARLGAFSVGASSAVSVVLFGALSVGAFAVITVTVGALVVRIFTVVFGFLSNFYTLARLYASAVALIATGKRNSKQKCGGANSA